MVWRSERSGRRLRHRCGLSAGAYKAGLKAMRRGDTKAAARKWITAARDWSAAHGLPGAKGIIIP